jgi:hypothetical protein
MVQQHPEGFFEILDDHWKKVGQIIIPQWEKA